METLNSRQLCYIQCVCVCVCVYIYIKSNLSRLEAEEQEQEALRETAKKKEKMREEEELRDKLLKNVQQLEKRKLEVQRELTLRALPASGLKSAVVVPTSD